MPLQVGHLGEGQVTLGALVSFLRPAHVLALSEVWSWIATFLERLLTL